jgi:SAM-dependent methyltransferase
MGALTTSLAEIVAPGEVIGIDREPSQVEAARLWADERGVRNVRFETANIFALPYPEASFDAVFSYTVLEHVKDPLWAMREMRRVLKPGGVAGICDPDYGALLLEPETPLLKELFGLMLAFSEEHGSPYYARRLRHYLLEAGFASTEGFAVGIGGGNPQAMRFNYEVVLKPTLETLRPWLVERGLAGEERVEALLAEALAWSQKPEAFFALMQCAAVAFVDEPAGL